MHRFFWVRVIQNLKNLGGHRGQNIFWKLGTNCDFNEVGTLQDLEDGKAKTDKKFDKCCRCGQLEGCMVAPLGGWATNIFVTSTELFWLGTQCLDQPRVGEKPGKSPIPLKEAEISSNHLKPLPIAFSKEEQILKTPSRCTVTLFATGRGFDDLLFFTKGNGKGLWQWEGVLWFVA